MTAGRVCIDSGSASDVVEDLVIRDRRHLSEDGFVLPILTINKLSGKVERQPELVTRGFVGAEQADGRRAPGCHADARRLQRRREGRLRRDQGKIRIDLKRYIQKNTSRRPLIMPVILEILSVTCAEGATRGTAPASLMV